MAVDCNQWVVDKGSKYTHNLNVEVLTPLRVERLFLGL